MKNKNTLKHPDTPEDWQQNLRSFSMRIGFNISLTRCMMEMLCAIADDCHWDRGLYYEAGNVAAPDNFIAPLRALEKRGLVQRKSDDEIKKSRAMHDTNTTWAEMCEWSHYRLTPAGECVVKLLKLAGMFIESDAAINKKSKRA